MREWFSVDRTVSWRNAWAGICGLVLAWGVAAQMATAQDKASILERAEEVASFLELLENENSIVRQMAIADGLASDNRYIRDAAIEAGFNSSDIMVRKETIAGVLQSKPFFVIEIPVDLDPRLAAHDNTKWWSVARLEVTSEYFDPDNFSIVARNGYNNNTQECLIRSDEVVCRGRSGGTHLTLRPGTSGTFTGKVENGDWRLPIVIRNY